jgi:hypothetical protein
MPIDEKLKAVPGEKMGEEIARERQDHCKSAELSDLGVIDKEPIDLRFLSRQKLKMEIELRFFMAQLHRVLLNAAATYRDSAIHKPLPDLLCPDVRVLLEPVVDERPVLIELGTGGSPLHCGASGVKLRDGLSGQQQLPANVPETETLDVFHVFDPLNLVVHFPSLPSDRLAKATHASKDAAYRSAAENALLPTTGI